jgi:hypothetical protein
VFLLNKLLHPSAKHEIYLLAIFTVVGWRFGDAEKAHSLGDHVLKKCMG